MRDRLREATATAIIAAAEQVVAEQGVEGARMEEIARRAGIAVGTLYNYFADRDALMDAMREERKIELLGELDQCLGAIHGQPFRAQLEGFLRTTFAYYERHRQFFTQLMAADQVAKKHHAPSTELMAEVYARVEKVMKVGLREGVLRPSHAEYYPAMLFAMVRAATMVQLYRKQPTPLTDLVGPLVHLFLHGASSASEKRT